MKKYNKPEIIKERIDTYYAHKDGDNLVIDYHAVTSIYEYDGYSYIHRGEFRLYDENGQNTDGAYTRRRYEGKNCVIERFNLNDELICRDLYDDDDRILESKDQYGKTLYTYHYDYTKSVSRFDNDDILIFKTIYEFDHLGRITKSIHMNEGGSTEEHTHHYSKNFIGDIVETIIDSDGNVTRVDTIDALTDKLKMSKSIDCEDTSIIYSDIYGTDSLRHSWTKSVNGKLVEDSACLYEYDKRGNWILAVRPSMVSDVELEVLVRELEYYETNEFA